ncbi:hypothetical protein CR513_17394, partial [Mucuna pruriens]
MKSAIRVVSADFMLVMWYVILSVNGVTLLSTPCICQPQRLELFTTSVFVWRFFKLRSLIIIAETVSVHKIFGLVNAIRMGSVFFQSFFPVKFNLRND